MARHAARRAAMQLVYENAQGGEGGEDTLFGLIEFPKEDEDLDYVYRLANGVKAHEAELTGIISRYSPERETDRIPLVFRSLLSVALYELIYEKEVPDSVIISEAVDLTKRFSDPKDARFVNGLLGAYLRENPRT